jgi:predicted RNA-binding protein associated with RNAse of E/G family
VDISQDEVLIRNSDHIITRWFPIKPRGDIGWGISYLDLNGNRKISAFYGKNGKLLYWYCDIVEVAYFESSDLYVIKDLLVDVKLVPGQLPEILDLHELEMALKQGLIDKNEFSLAVNVSKATLELLNHEIPDKIKEILKYGPPVGFVKKT